MHHTTKFLPRGIRLFPFVFGILFLVQSCRNDDDLGSGVQPENSRVGVLSTDTLTVEATLVRQDSIRADLGFIRTLGSLVDPDFGYTESDYYSQLRIERSDIYFGDPSTIVVDSVVLALRLDGAYGADVTTGDSILLDEQNFVVYEIIEDLELDSAYYNDTVIATDPTPIGGITVRPNATDSVFVFDIDEPAQLRIPLENSWAEKLLLADASVHESNDNFMDFMKGIRVAVENPVQSENQGHILYIRPQSDYTRVTVYYHSDQGDSLRYNYEINGVAENFSTTRHDYTGSALESVIDVPGGATELGYIQALAGLAIELQFPTYYRFLDSNYIMINGAEIVITDADPSRRMDQCVGLDAAAFDTNGTLVFTPDSEFQEVDGTYDPSKGRYSLRLTRYFSELAIGHADGRDLNKGVLLLPVGNLISANRVVTVGTNPTAADGRLKLKLTYTRLNRN